ncbi:gastrulation-defective [Carabus blaptoides fortunei]
MATIHEESSATPCPSVFQYQYDGDEWYGLIAAPGVPYGTPAMLVARFSIGRVLPTKYAGSLDLLGTRTEVLHAMLNERPMKYRVNFPLQYPLPQVTAITLNTRIICTGPIVAGPIVTHITLEYKLYPHGQNLRPQQQPPPQHFPARDLASSSVIPVIVELDDNDAENGGTHVAAPSSAGTSTSTPATSAMDVIERNVVADVCGRPVSGQPLIANGEVVQRGSYPWLAAVFAQKPLGLEFTCGSNLISRRHLVTAAHCIKYGENRALSANELLIILGKYRIHKWTESGTVVREALHVHLHPDYRALNSDADLAVIVLAESVTFTPTVRPVCVWPEASELTDLVGKHGTIVGWGRDETGAKITAVPRQTRVLVVSQEQCLRSKLEFRYFTSNRTLCAGGVHAGAGPCTGDSGGGLLVQRTGRWYLRGIISLSLTDPDTRTCDLNNYSVFVDMAKFVDWIGQFI